MALKKSVLFVFLAFLTVFVWADKEDNINDIDEVAKKMSQKYEEQIVETLSKYINKKSFIVDVKVNLRREEVPTKFKKQSILEQDEDILSDVPVLPFGDESTVSNFENNNTNWVPGNMPGLPFYAEQKKQEDRMEKVARDTLVPVEFDTKFAVNNIYASVMVSAFYMDEELEFVKKAVKLVVGYDEDRGDIVNVSSDFFPEKVNPEEQVENVSAIDFLPQKTFFEKFLWYIIIAAVLLIFIFLFLLMIRKFKLNSHEMVDSANITYETLLSEIKKIGSGEKKKTPAEAELDVYNSLRFFVVDRVLRDLTQVTSLLKAWIGEDIQAGLKKIAMFVRAVDDNLLYALEKSFDEKNFQLLSWTMQNLEEIDLKEKVEILEKFKKDWQLLSASLAIEDKESNMFSFLQELTDQQILSLFRTEPPAVKAMVLAQLLPEKSKELLSKIKEVERTKILINMNKLDVIPFGIYKQVSERLSSKALIVQDMKYISSDGIETILNILEHVPIAEQKNYILTIAQTDLALAENILKFYVPFEDVLSINSAILMKVMQSLDRETIVNAMAGAPIEFIQAMVGFLPARMREMVISELQTGMERKTADVENARKVILKGIRKELKLIGGREVRENNGEGTEV